MSIAKHLHVTCAIIERDGLVLAVQRSATMSLPLKWEFPGGKIDGNESHEDCLRRELLEELGLRAAIRRSLPPSSYQYPTFGITLYPFICSIESGEPELREHSVLRWLPVRNFIHWIGRQQTSPWSKRIADSVWVKLAVTWRE